MKTKILSIILIIFLATNCSEDFLNRGPVSEETSDNFFNTDENALSALISVYNVIRGQETFGLAKWAIGSVGSDEAEAGGQPGGSDQTDVQEMDRLIMGSINQKIIEGPWFGYYSGLLRTNIVLEKVKDNPNLTPALRDRYVGEAYVLRALFHLELLMIYGAVPKVDHVLSSEEYSSPKRASMRELFDLIYDDCDKGLEYLTPTINQRINGRIDASGAVALKIKAMIYESSYADNYAGDSRFEGCVSRWSEVATLANDFISNAASYGIGLASDYALIWRKAGETDPTINCEYIISASAARLAGYEGHQVGIGSNDIFESRQSTNVVATIWQSCRRYYPDNNFVNTPALDGWGFNCPTQRFVDQFDQDDPRLELSVVSDKDPWNFWGYGDIFLCTAESPTGYNSKKYIMYGDSEFGDISTSPHTSCLDYKIFRFADLLLLAAEANLKNGDAAEATRLVNLVRTRARNSGTTGHPLDLTTNVTLEDILKERSMELGLEGQRYFDLVRTKHTSEMSGANNFNKTINQEITFETGKHELLPIPNSAIVRANGSLEQNPGY